MKEIPHYERKCLMASLDQKSHQEKILFLWPVQILVKWRDSPYLLANTLCLISRVLGQQLYQRW